MLEEFRRRHGAGFAPAHVLQISYRALKMLVVKLEHREAMHEVTATLARRLDGLKALAATARLVREHGRYAVPQRDNLCAGQRGDVDRQHRLVRLCIRKRVSQQHSTFGIGVEYLDGHP